MKFFIPQVAPRDAELAYQNVVKALKDQLRTAITDRRIFKLAYTHDKKRRFAEVGRLEQHEGRYEIVAILESRPYIVFTRSKTGGQGVTILVGPDEITSIENFD